jgi:hypothetical protein
MKVAGSPQHVTPLHFLERARHYRLAEAVADTLHDVAMFADLAVMFEQLAAHVARFDSPRSAEPHRQEEGLRPGGVRSLRRAL